MTLAQVDTHHEIYDRSSDRLYDLRRLAYGVVAQAFDDVRCAQRAVDRLATAARIHGERLVLSRAFITLSHDHTARAPRVVRMIEDDIEWFDNPDGYWLWAALLDIPQRELDAIRERYRAEAAPVLERLREMLGEG